MKRLMLALLGAIAVITSLIPGAQASTTSAAKPARETLVVAGGRETLTVRPLSASQAAWRHINPPQHKCAALSHPAADCTVFGTTHLSKVSVTDSTAYWRGYMQACAVVYSTGGCNTNYWWVTDYFNFTTDFNTGQAWNNGTPSCAANHTNYTWCSYVGNGTTNFQEGFNFGNGGWARMDITSLQICDVRGPSWANVSGFVFDFANNSGYTCPYNGT